MIIYEKVSKALRSATTHLENLIAALNKKDENSLADSLWHVAAELEYALFLFSIKRPNETNMQSLKRNFELKKIGTGSVLAEVKNLLNKAEGLVANEELLDAYKSVYVARHYVFKIQEDLAKKKREMFKKK
jgi:hypothetical protein